MQRKNRSSLVASRRDFVAGAGLALTVAPPPAMSAAAVGPEADVELRPGIHRIAIDRTIAGNLTIWPGAVLEIAAGARLILLGDLTAPATRIFAGEGEIVLARSRVFAARPEWWGAAADDARVDCTGPIEAALRAHPYVQLGLGDYHLMRTLNIDQPNRRLWGIGRTDNACGTRLVGHMADGPVVLAGTRVTPPSINAYLRGIDMRWIEIGRASLPSTKDAESARPIGLTISHVLDCVFEGLRANEHAVGYFIQGAVRTYLIDCVAFRSIFTDERTDIFIGFDLDGRGHVIATGANASLYLIDCNARTGNRPRLPISVGCRLLAAFSDTFLVRFETTELSHGILVDGLAEAASTRQHTLTQLNLHIDTPVLDQCGEACLVLRNLSDCAMIDIVTPWLALGEGGHAALRMTDCQGATSVTGGQAVGSPRSDAIGVHLDRVSGLAFTGLKLLGFSQPIDASESRGLDLVGAVFVDRARGSAAVALRGCADSYVRIRGLGTPTGHAAAIHLDRNCENITIEPSTSRRSM